MFESWHWSFVQTDCLENETQCWSTSKELVGLIAKAVANKSHYAPPIPYNFVILPQYGKPFHFWCKFYITLLRTITYHPSHRRHCWRWWYSQLPVWWEMFWVLLLWRVILVAYKQFPYNWVIPHINSKITRENHLLQRKQKISQGHTWRWSFALRGVTFSRDCDKMEVPLILKNYYIHIYIYDIIYVCVLIIMDFVVFYFIRWWHAKQNWCQGTRMIRVTCNVWHCILQPHSRSPSDPPKYKLWQQNLALDE